MTDAPNRKIGGLTPRREAAPLARLMKSQREAPAPVNDATGTEGRPATPPRKSSGPRTKAPVASAPAQEPADEPKEAITIRIPGSLRARSRAAFLATRSAEGDESYSEMIAKAIEAEVQRRESAHNDGRSFGGGATQLPPGRPLSS